MIKSLEEWPDELCEIDAELISLLHRRTQLAIQLLGLVRSGPLTLGELQHDLDRLDIFLYAEIEEPILPTLDKHALLKIFRCMVIEEKRLAAWFEEGTSDPSRFNTRNCLTCPI